jgi:hypothetical protein
MNSRILYTEMMTIELLNPVFLLVGPGSGKITTIVPSGRRGQISLYQNTRSHTLLQTAVVGQFHFVRRRRWLIASQGWSEVDHPGD